MGKNFVLSTCGTSLLTSNVDKNLRKCFNRNANKNNLEDIPKNDQAVIKDRIKKVETELLNSNFKEVQKRSAELNALLNFYDNKLKNKKDFHLLICTDTFLGLAAANIIKKWLDQYSFTVQIEQQKDLKTKNLESFQLALSDLTKKLSEWIDGYKSKKYEIIFNLTGGFKGVTGFLQSIAMFYADETIYIFETETDLLRIPSLPVKLESIEEIDRHLDIYRKINLDIPLNEKEKKEIPDTLIMSLDNEIEFTGLGTAIWDNAQKEIYKKEIIEPITNKVKFSDKFRKSIENLDSDRIYNLNKKIEALEDHLNNNKRVLKSLSLKPIKGNPNGKKSTHEFYAWSDKDAKRCYGHFDKNTFIIDELGKHL